jgi:ribosome-binding factor A
MKHQLRRIPVIHFYNDDTLDYVFKMEEILKGLDIKEEQKEEGQEEDI